MKLQKLQFITELEVDHAEYRLADAAGNEIVLFVDYKKNEFATEYLGATRSVEFEEEVKKLAQGMLARKHGTNLAKKEHFL